MGRAESRSLLLLTGDPGVSENLGSGLRRSGYEVTAAMSAATALEAAASAACDLALVDMRLPDLAEADAAELLHRQWDIPSLFLSPSDDRLTVDRAIRAGGLGFLVKPVALNGLIPAIEAALACSRVIREATEQSAHLEKALAASRIVSVAIGITMVKSGMTQAEAFEHLRRLARKQRKRIEAVAEKIVVAPRCGEGEEDGHDAD
jgi:AmiR/NasT family two-component response regulator